jgi:ubiquinone/menaquinone biosynthesis C-methylase UbiE
MSLTAPGADLFPGSTEDDWHRLLARSIREPIINGVEMPRFPHGNVQRGFVGSADEQTLNEANNFWRYVKKAAIENSKPIDRHTRLLDFGSAWGRYSRYFWRDIDPSNIQGCDIDPEIVATCRYLGVPGTYSVIEPAGKLPYADGSMDLIIAYSVFTHLPENVAEHWMKELSRVAAPGALIAYTVEPRRFLQFIETLDPNSPSMWHALMATFKDRVPELLAKFDGGEFCYIPTSGGAYRDADVYGDSAISERYITERWSKYFQLVKYHDEPREFWQGVVTARKP